jgi:hypothetical protein
MKKFLFQFLVAFSFFLFSHVARADPDPKPPAAPTPQELQTQVAALLKRAEDQDREIAELKKGKGKDDDKDKNKKDDDGDDLRKKAQNETDEKARKSTEQRQIERAVNFNLTVDTFTKEHKDILPAEVDGILKQAAKENYDTAVEKSNALKEALVKSYFSVQANVDQLTSSQKSSLADWDKLTKNARLEKVADVYENIFEPAIDTLKRVKKAEEVGRARSGLANRTDSHQSYRDRLIAGSQKAYLGIKSA